jgi:hypothetical protein
MKVLNIVVGGKTYTTERITTGLSREAMRVNAETFALAKFCHDPPENMTKEECAEEMVNRNIELSDRKLNLICRVYENQFGVDELENSLTNADVAAQISKIMQGVGSIVSKN